MSATRRPSRRAAIGWTAIGWAVVASSLAVLVVAPVGRLVTVATSAGWDGVRRAVATSRASEAVGNTLWVSVVSTLVAVPLGIAMALIVDRGGPGDRAGLRAGLLLPLVVPRFVLGFSWLQAYGESGLLDDAAGLRFPGLVGPAGIVAVTAVTMAPIAFLIVTAALAVRAEPDLDRAARASGASAWASLRTITLPLVRPAAVAAAAVVFAASVESFAIPAVLGIRAGFAMMTTRMYQQLTFSADPAAFTAAVILALLMVAIVLLAVAPFDRILSSRAVPLRATPAGGSPSGSPRPVARAATAGLWTYIVLVVLVPLAALTLSALTRAVGLPAVPANWSLENFRQAFSGPSWSALGRSMALALAAAAILAVLGGLLAGLERVSGWRRSGTLVTLSFALPGSALAIGLLTAYGRWIGGTITIILLAYLAKLWALSHRSIASSLERLPADVLHAARASGAHPLTAIRSVALPPLVPAVVAGFALVFLFAFHEVTMSALLYGPGSRTLGVVVLNLQELGDVGRTSALAVVMVAVAVASALAMLAAWRAGRRLIDGRRT